MVVIEKQSIITSKECLQLLKESLLVKRAEKEKYIQDLSAQLIQLGVQKHEFDKEGSTYSEECNRVQSLINGTFSELKKINIVLDSLEKGTFTGICNDCKKCIPEEELLGSPTRKLCVSCQQKMNNK